MLGIRSIVTAAFAAAAVIAASNTAVFGEHYGFAPRYNPRYVERYDYPYFGHHDYPADEYDLGSYDSDYRPFDDARGYQFRSHQAISASWFVPQTYEPAVRQHYYAVPPRSWDSLDFEFGGRCECSNAGYLVPNPLLPRRDSIPPIGTFDSRPPVPADLPPTLNQEQMFSEPAASIPEGLRKLAPRDRQAALTQRTCPVTGDILGSDGTPLKVRVGDRDVFVCCEGCVADIQANPNKFLPALESGIERQPAPPSALGHAGKHDHSSHTHDR